MIVSISMLYALHKALKIWSRVTAMLRVPAERLLVETDAPYLSPQVVRGRPNQPAHVVHTAQALAIERRVSYEELEADVEHAAAEVFRW